MRSFLVATIVGFWAAQGTARAEEFYVAPGGDDGAPGSEQAPFRSIERAEQAASAGDTVWIRGGEYRFSGTSSAVGVAFTKSGSPDNPIHYFAYEGETPVFDLFELRPQERITGFDIRASAIHLRGLEVRGVRQLIVGDSWGVRVRGDNNILERLHVHDNEAPGIFITSGASNLLLNCDSHNNYDPLEQGGNGDGFGCHSGGANNVLRGCRAWWNSDDGFDFINAPGTCVVENSWAFRNGFVPETNMGAGNGAGFKAGGFGSPPNIPGSGVPRHVVRFNLSFRNRSQGFYANHHPGGLDFLNNTALGNGVNFDMLVEGGQSTHKLHNNLAVDPGGAVMRWSGGDDANNSWNSQVMVSDADFLSMDESEAMAPRQPDGSLPAIRFMHLADGSDLIDRGRDVGLKFAGGGPDLGAFEHEGETSAGPGAAVDAGMPMQPGSGMQPQVDAGMQVPMDAGAPMRPSTGPAMQTPPASAGSSAPTAPPGMRSTSPVAAAAGSVAVANSAGSPAAPSGVAGAEQSTQAVSAEDAALAGRQTIGSDGCGCYVVGGSKPVGRGWALLLLAAGVMRMHRRRGRLARARERTV
jgi:hypothetical protein